MDFVKHLTVAKSFFLPASALLAWPLLFSAYLFTPQDSKALGVGIAIIIAIMAALWALLVLYALMYFLMHKQSRNAGMLVLGILLTVGLLVFETIVIFGFGIAGGATG